MATIRQRISLEVVGDECCKCKRVLDLATVEEVLRRQRVQNQKNIRFALESKNKNKRKSQINLNQVLRLRDRGFTFKQIGKELGFTPTAIFERLKKARIELGEGLYEKKVKIR